MASYAKIFSGLCLLAVGCVAAFYLWPSHWWPHRYHPDPQKTKNLRAISQNVKPLHRPIGKIQSGDWLASHKENGQTFSEYLASRPNTLTKKRNILYVQPIGDFSKDQRKILDLTTEFMSLYFDCPVKLKETLPVTEIDDDARRVHPSWGVRQLLTTYILDDVLKPNLPDDAFAMIAFTSTDLWPGKGWNFVFGQAALRGRVGVWSIYRNGDPSRDEKSFVRCLERTLKTATHETGHMFSINHCIAYRCNMNGSNNRSESDRHPVFMCPECLAKVLYSTNANAINRFEKLAKFCEREKLNEGAKYYRDAVKANKPSKKRKQK